MRKFVPILAAALTLAAAVPLFGQNALRQELKDIDTAPHWIYDDLPRAFAEAKATGKPILVVLRCVPCPPGKTLDLKVMQPDKKLEELEKKFVCVRVIKTNGLDLNLFQYDYDQSWAAMFLNADKVIYGRYGTRTSTGPGSDAPLTEEGFTKALERALEIHKNYPANKDQLVNNTGKPARWAVPEKIPGLAERHTVPVTRKSCIHCHMVREYQVRAVWEKGELTPEELYVYPKPENLGIMMDVKDGLRVNALAKDTPAEEAGVTIGDEIVALNGQPLTSQADIQWVLHNLPKKAELKVTLKRDGQTLEKTILLDGDWKKTDLAWRASSWYGLRGGFKVEPLTPEARKQNGIADGKLGLVVKGIYGKSTAVLNQAGLRVGDVIVAVDGKDAALTESDFLVQLRTTHGPNDVVVFTVLRGKQRQELKVPMW